MDVHPTPFPAGKRRSVANPAAKDAARMSKPSKKAPPAQALTAAQTRPTRAFGVPRSANIPIEKPLAKPALAKTCKPWKPSGASTNPTKSGTPKVGAAEKPSSQDAAGGSSSSKAKVDAKKKHQHVSFEEPKTAAVVKSVAAKTEPEDGTRTPVCSIKPAAAEGTPYLSAQNCSDCSLDKLESATYWLAQIKRAESVGKHFVAAAFFRLALECHAQPFHRLQRDLKHYVARHQASRTGSSWDDLCQAYGLSNDSADAASSSIDQIVQKEDRETHDGCLDYGGIDGPKANVSETPPTIEGVDISDAQLKDSDTNTAGQKDNFIGIEVGNAELTLSSAEEFFSESKNFEATNISTGEQQDNTNEIADPTQVNSSEGFYPQSKTCGASDFSHGSHKKSSGASDSERNSSRVKSKAGMVLSSERLSSSSTKAQGSGGSAANSGKNSSKNKELARCNTSGARMGRSGQVRSRGGGGDEHSCGPQISGDFNSAVFVEDGAANQR